MADSSSSKPGSGAARALVLGGSEGIGLAQAERAARAGARIVLVARGVDRLVEARENLIAAGALEVEVREANLTDSDARRALLDSLAEEGGFRSVFIGGPGPKPGRAVEVSQAEHASAREVCINYPEDVFTRATKLMAAGGELILLSSSASLELVIGHRFYLSAVYRHELDASAEGWRGRLAKHAIELTILHPKVVLTPLSRRYAEALGARGEEGIADRLKSEFEASRIPSPSEFIDTKLPRLKSYLEDV